MKLNRTQKMMIYISAFIILYMWFTEDLYLYPSGNWGSRPERPERPGEYDYELNVAANFDWAVVLHMVLLSLVTAWMVYLSVTPRWYLVLGYFVFLLPYLVRIIGGAFDL